MADFRKPAGSGMHGYDKAANRQTLGLGEYTEVALWGGDNDGYRLTVSLDNPEIADIRELPSYSTEYTKLAQGDPNIRIFRLYGRKKGDARLEARVFAVGSLYVYMEVRVQEHSVTGASTPDLLYNGIQLAWIRSLPKGEQQQVFSATSGNVNGQLAELQQQVNMGPIPAGRYKFLARLDPHYYSTTTLITPEQWVYLDGREGIQEVIITWPDGSTTPYEAWGANRVRLSPVGRNKAPHRGGFYLHDSKKGFTHGCIELDRRFFPLLRQYAAERGNKSWLSLEVAYGASATTYGFTREGEDRPTYFA